MIKRTARGSDELSANEGMFGFGKERPRRFGLRLIWSLTVSTIRNITVVKIPHIPQYVPSVSLLQDLKIKSAATSLDFK